MATQHPITFAELLDYTEGRLSSSAAQRVATHLEGCADCQAEVAWLRRTLGLMAADALVSAPPAVVEKAQRLYRPPERRRRLTPGGLWGRLRVSRLALRPAAIALAAVLMLAGLCWGWGQATVAQAATLARVVGPVEVRLYEGGEWQAAAEGMRLAAGSAVRSGEGATAVLQYPDGSVSELAAQAEVEILSVTGPRNGHTTNVHLNQVAGCSEHELKRSQSTLQVDAPGASARGHQGDYEVSVGAGEVEVHAGRGDVDLSVDGNTTRLGPGERGQVKGGQVHVATPAPGRSGDGACTPASRGQGSQRPGRAPTPKPTKEKPIPPGQQDRDQEKPVPPGQQGKDREKPVPPGQQGRDKDKPMPPGQQVRSSKPGRPAWGRGRHPLQP